MGSVRPVSSKVHFMTLFKNSESFPSIFRKEDEHLLLRLPHLEDPDSESESFPSSMVNKLLRLEE